MTAVFEDEVTSKKTIDHVVVEIVTMNLAGSGGILLSYNPGIEDD